MGYEVPDELDQARRQRGYYGQRASGVIPKTGHPVPPLRLSTRRKPNPRWRTRPVLKSRAMTAFQQAALHAVIALVVIAATVALACTGNLSSEAVTVILAAGGISSTGVAGVTTTTPAGVSEAPKSGA